MATPLSSQQLEKLQSTALKVREHIIDMSTDGGCFTGASLSCTDILVYLYENFVNVGPHNFSDQGRDYVLLSKGHDVPALYGVFVEKGWMTRDRLIKNHLKADDHIYWHPNRAIKGIEFHSGSLGHLPSVSLGIAYDCKRENTNNKIICIVGDGECDEGSVWEAMLVASAKKVNNLTIVVDRNHFQANVATEELIPLEPFADKFEAFGAVVRRIDGHDYEALHQTFNDLPFHDEKPSVIICDTVRGKGLPSIEARADRWFCNFSKDEIASLHEELHGRAETHLTSEVLVVR
jgi:transketolase